MDIFQGFKPIQARIGSLEKSLETTISSTEEVDTTFGRGDQISPTAWTDYKDDEPPVKLATAGTS